MMKIRLGARMTKGPEGDVTVTKLQHCADADLKGMPLPDDAGEVDNQVKPEFIPGRMAEAGQRLEGRLLGHVLSIAAETVNIPITTGGKIEFPVSAGILHPDKAFETALPPQPMPATARFVRAGNGEILDIPSDLIL